MTPEKLAEISARAYKDMAPWSAKDFADTLARPIACLTHTAHAFVFGQIVADEAEILALATDPAHQRGGEAAKALALFHDEALARGAATCFLEVAAGNAAALAFYAKHGYRETGLRRGYYKQADGSTQDAVLMARALT